MKRLFIVFSSLVVASFICSCILFSSPSSSIVQVDENSTETFSVNGYGSVEWFLNGSPTGVTGNTYIYSPSSGKASGDQADILVARSSLAGRVYTKQWSISTFSCAPLTYDGNIHIKKTNDIKKLEKVTYLRGNLIIAEDKNLTTGNNESLITNLDMLKCLHRIDGDLIIQNNKNLRNTDGLRYLTSVTGNISILNNRLDALNLKSLTTIGGELTIADNTMLQNLSGLESLTAVGSHIALLNNEVMRDIWGLSNLTKVNGDLIIEGNSALTNIDPLKNNLRSIHRDLVILSNSTISKIIVDNLETIGGNLIIQNNSNDVSLAKSLNIAFDSLKTVGGYMDISNNTVISLSGSADFMTMDLTFTELKSISGRLTIDNNAALTTIESSEFEGFPALKTIDGNLEIKENDELTLLRLQALEFIGTDMLITDNRILPECWTKIIENKAVIGGEIDISGNFYDATACAGDSDLPDLSKTVANLASDSKDTPNEPKTPLDATGESSPDADLSNTDKKDIPEPDQPDKDKACANDECLEAVDDCPDNPNKTSPGICGCNIPDLDDDADGIMDCVDNCKGIKNTDQKDTDEDGVGNSCDECDNDALKTDPGICGCGVEETDSDGDGTPDCKDGCPNDNRKTTPGLCGCGTEDMDTDKDGTPDCRDECPYDNLKLTPGICGCGVSDSDKDKDGTPNCFDKCPNDPNKIKPGACGCGVADTDSDHDGVLDCNDDCDGNSVDTDGDGTPDCSDGCPNDSFKTTPGECGCGISDSDMDKDGTPNCIDNCPLDPQKTEPGENGCGVADTGTTSIGTPHPKEDDECPNDPKKTDPGICGCGVADTDSDYDGTVDCKDRCPNDPQKTRPGTCGCGTSDKDSDGDKTPDCNDSCPNDPQKTRPGLCGCGASDADNNNDGLPDCNEISAHISISHPDNRDLVVSIGVGEPDAPTWEKTVWKGNYHMPINEDLTLDVDITNQRKYLPPSKTNAWYIRVHNIGRDKDTVNSFTITYKGKSYTSDMSQLQVSRSQSATYAYIPEAPEDTTPPTPRPPYFSSMPKVKYALVSRTITMTAETASDRSDVEYYFEETTNQVGGTDSGWQKSPTYTDEVAGWTTYQYRVKVRDKSTGENIIVSPRYSVAVY